MVLIWQSAVGVATQRRAYPCLDRSSDNTGMMVRDHVKRLLQIIIGLAHLLLPL